ncbi:S-adenosyl-L-methionine-dependent methyltransferase [Lactifluus volemus]|nr:S-adenosyl-L-methionine-dependent methyltransferase [Lactifluus volemus]
MSIRPTVPLNDPRRKDCQFVEKHGRKHHKHPPGKAPYPISYDRDVLDSDAIDHYLWRSLFDGRPTMIATPNDPPRRVLDLGCGVGMWTIDAARKWPDATFVGFDLVNVQFPLNHLESHVARRITWEHGNCLSNKLPFEDDTFDLVNITHISKGVPEHKWTSLFEEVRRVMQPDGFVQVLEEDIIFPVLPRWFTEPLRASSPSSNAANTRPGSNDSSTLVLPSPPATPLGKSLHEHVLLEYLFKSVFESRFINLKPTGLF